MPAASTHRTSQPKYAVAAATLFLLAGGAAWLYSHRHVGQAQVAVKASSSRLSTPQAEAGSAVAITELPSATPASAAGALALQGRPTIPFFAPKDSAGEALRKVQLALSGASAEDALRAADALTDCSRASEVVDALFAVRDQPYQVPPVVRQIVDGPGSVTHGKIEQAQDEQRRCQVFDPTSLARRGELLQEAYEGGAQGSTLPYLQWLQSPDEVSGRARGKADPALVAKLQAELRSAAESGDMAVLPVLAFASGDIGRQLGITPMQQQAFREAWLLVLVDGVHGDVTPLRKNLDAQFAPAAPLTAAQQSEADALTKRVLDAWRRSNRP